MNIEIGWEIFVINENLSDFNKYFSAFLLTSLGLFENNKDLSGRFL